MLSVDEIRRTFEDDLFSELDVLLITGGEPSVRGDIGEAVAAILDVPSRPRGPNKKVAAFVQHQRAAPGPGC